MCGRTTTEKKRCEKKTCIGKSTIGNNGRAATLKETFRIVPAYKRTMNGLMQKRDSRSRNDKRKGHRRKNPGEKS